MPNIRVIDEAGNKQDYDAPVVPRIGERIVLQYGVGAEPIKRHQFRVHDVVHDLNNASGSQISVFVVEEDESKLLPQ